MKNNFLSVSSMPMTKWGGGSQAGINTKPFIRHMAANFLLACVAGGLVLISLTDLPLFSMFLVDLIFSLYLCSIFSQKTRLLFLLHPFVMLLSNQFYEVSFLELGDGDAYRVVVEQYIDNPALIASVFESFGMIGAFKFLSLGILPVYAIPKYLYVAPESGVYYLWQGVFHVTLVALCVTLAKAWKVFRLDYLLAISLFAAVSPTFYKVGIAPTRHIVTFAAVFLFYISFVALFQRFSIGRLAGVLAAVALVAISKFPLFIPIIIFGGYYTIFERKGGGTLKKFIFFIILIAAALIGFDEFFSKVVEYQENSSSGAATFSGLVNIPLIGMFFKYLYALLAPFPWHEAPLFVETLFGGNYFLFFMSMLSSLTGIYFFARLIRYWKPLVKHYSDIRPPIVFGLIMSSSILFGSTGFQMYLMIYYPFFAPLFLIQSYRLSFWFPVFFVAVVEAVYGMASL